MQYPHAELMSDDIGWKLMQLRNEIDSYSGQDMYEEILSLLNDWCEDNYKEVLQRASKYDIMIEEETLFESE